MLQKLKASLLFAMSFLICLAIIWSVQYYRTYQLTIIGKTQYADGIGRQIIDHYRMLDTKDNKINLVSSSIHSLKDLTLTEIIEVTNPLVKFGNMVMYEAVLPVNGETHDLTQLFHKKFMKFSLINRDKHLIAAYTMFESSKIMDSWVTMINQNFDLAILPDNFLVEVYKNSGVTKPTFVLPLQIDITYFLNAPIKTKRNDVFIFSNLSSTIERKNLVKLVEAYVQAFGDRKDVKLLINSRNGNHEAIQKLKSVIAKYPNANIEYQLKSLSETEYRKMISDSDCYVSPSKSEGFSIIPRQTMAQGIPTIVTNNTGQSTIAKSGLTEVVKSEIVEPGIFAFSSSVPIGEYYDCHVADLAKAMLNVYNNYDQYLKKSQKMREWSAFYNIDSINLKKYYTTLLLKPNGIKMGKQNEITPDGYIITNSKEFYDKYSKIMKLDTKSE